uniref:Ovule protein n=1 Tax=Rodentolepis nana TaxID=102285 RepID=A0A0R3TZV9_RODNA
LIRNMIILKPFAAFSLAIKLFKSIHSGNSPGGSIIRPKYLAIDNPPSSEAICSIKVLQVIR